MFPRDDDRGSWPFLDAADPGSFNEWTLLEGIGIGITIVAFGVVGGVVGVGLGVVLVVAWVGLPTVHSYAVGHALALGLTARSLPAVELFLVEIGLLAVLLGPLTDPESRPGRGVARWTFGFGAGLLGALVVGLAIADRIWVVALGLLLIGVGLGYALNRYEVVALGLATDDMDGGGTRTRQNDPAPGALGNTEKSSE
jgi:hypothetical protein